MDDFLLLFRESQMLKTRFVPMYLGYVGDCKFNYTLLALDPLKYGKPKSHTPDFINQTETHYSWTANQQVIVFQLMRRRLRMLDLSFTITGHLRLPINNSSQSIDLGPLIVRVHTSSKDRVDHDSTIDEHAAYFSLVISLERQSLALSMVASSQ